MTASRPTEETIILIRAVPDQNFSTPRKPPQSHVQVQHDTGDDNRGGKWTRSDWQGREIITVTRRQAR
jgi:hypothetical protein